MSQSIEKVKQTVRDLLNLAENNAATEGEIDNALRFARRLMERHHITEDDCKDAHTQAAAEEIMGMAYAWGRSQALDRWEKNLAWVVRDLIGSIGHYMNGVSVAKDANGLVQFDPKTGQPKKLSSMMFYGPAEDVALAVELFGNLRLSVIAMARLKYGGCSVGPGRSYAEGFVSGMADKIRNSRQADKESNPETRSLIVRSTALATAKREKALAWLRQEKGIRLRNGSGSSSATHHAGAYGDGQADGRKASVSATRRNKLDGSAQRRLN